MRMTASRVRIIMALWVPGLVTLGVVVDGFMRGWSMAHASAITAALGVGAWLMRKKQGGGDAAA